MTIRLFLRRLLKNNIEIADDLAQESFLIAYRKLGTFKGESSFVGWLYGIAKNQFLMLMRKSHYEYNWDDHNVAVDMTSRIEAKVDLEEAMLKLRPIEIAAITKHEGFKWIMRKHYFDVRLNPADGD